MQGLDSALRRRVSGSRSGSGPGPGTRQRGQLSAQPLDDPSSWRADRRRSRPSGPARSCASARCSSRARSASRNRRGCATRRSRAGARAALVMLEPAGAARAWTAASRAAPPAVAAACSAVGARQRRQHAGGRPGRQRALAHRAEQGIGQRAQQLQAPADPTHIAPAAPRHLVLAQPLALDQLAQQQRFLDGGQRARLGARQHPEQRLGQIARPALDAGGVAPQSAQRSDAPIAVDQHQPPRPRLTTTQGTNWPLRSIECASRSTARGSTTRSWRSAAPTDAGRPLRACSCRCRYSWARRYPCAPRMAMTSSFARWIPAKLGH